MDDNSFGLQMKDFLATPCGQELETRFMIRRELIISKGKRIRGEGKDIRVWAELAGLDGFWSMIQNVVNQTKQKEMEIED